MRESLQQRLRKWNSAPSAAVAPCCLSCQVLANQRKPETRFNVTNMFKTCERNSDFTHYANLMHF